VYNSRPHLKGAIRGVPSASAAWMMLKARTMSAAYTPSTRSCLGRTQGRVGAGPRLGNTGVRDGEEAIIIAAFTVVAFSIFAQGLTMPWLINYLA
jgi:NhaP-type Na+/H+ or K+/H+ antiporter